MEDRQFEEERREEIRKGKEEESEEETETESEEEEEGHFPSKGEIALSIPAYTVGEAQGKIMSMRGDEDKLRLVANSINEVTGLGLDLADKAREGEDITDEIDELMFNFEKKTGESPPDNRYAYDALLNGDATQFVTMMEDYKSGLVQGYTGLKIKKQEALSSFEEEADQMRRKGDYRHINTAIDEAAEYVGLDYPEEILEEEPEERQKSFREYLLHPMEFIEDLEERSKGQRKKRQEETIDEMKKILKPRYPKAVSEQSDNSNLAYLINDYVEDIDEMLEGADPNNEQYKAIKKRRDRITKLFDEATHREVSQKDRLNAFTSIVKDMAKSKERAVMSLTVEEEPISDILDRILDDQDKTYRAILEYSQDLPDEKRNAARNLVIKAYKEYERTGETKDNLIADAIDIIDSPKSKSVLETFVDGYIKEMNRFKREELASYDPLRYAEIKDERKRRKAAEFKARYDSIQNVKNRKLGLENAERGRDEVKIMEKVVDDMGKEVTEVIEGVFDLNKIIKQKMLQDKRIIAKQGKEIERQKKQSALDKIDADIKDIKQKKKLAKTAKDIDRLIKRQQELEYELDREKKDKAELKKKLKKQKKESLKRYETLRKQLKKAQKDKLSKEDIEKIQKEFNEREKEIREIEKEEESIAKAEKRIRNNERKLKQLEFEKAELQREADEIMNLREQLRQAEILGTDVQALRAELKAKQDKVKELEEEKEKKQKEKEERKEAKKKVKDEPSKQVKSEKETKDKDELPEDHVPVEKDIPDISLDKLQVRNKMTIDNRKVIELVADEMGDDIDKFAPGQNRKSVYSDWGKGFYSRVGPSFTVTSKQFNLAEAISQELKDKKALLQKGETPSKFTKQTRLFLKYAKK